MVKIYIDGNPVTVPSNFTVLQANEFIQNNIPHFCYHEKLLTAGNCRMCLVEIEKMPKPIASCAMTVSEGMKIFTNTPLVQKIRENVLEFLLINHPLDCPICDQGGECDLQNQSMAYGSDRSRFFENKRSVADKNFNFLIKAIMSRCIHCTRCVRFVTDICSVDVLGTTGRGTHTEIGLYSKNVLKSELSGNIIDLCPVGALTSKLYSFKARPWELRSVNLIDVFETSCTPIQMFFKNNEIYKVLPSKNMELNNIWISDRTRFSYDGLNMQRLEDPLIKNGNQFVRVTWKTAFEHIKKNVKYGSISGVFGKHIDLLSLFVFKKFLNNLGSSNIISNSRNSSNQDFVFPYLYNFNVKNSINNSLSLNNINSTDLVLLVGFDSRFESSSLNIKLKENSVQNMNFKCFTIGKPLSLNYKSTQLGWNLDILLKIFEGKHFLSKILKNSKNPKIIINSELQDFINPFDLLNKSNFAFFDIKFLNQNIADLNSIFLGANTNLFSKKEILKRSSSIIYLESEIALMKNKNVQNQFIIFQGFLGDESLKFSNVILPTFSFFEKDNYYLNVFGSFLTSNKISTNLKNIRPDTKIFAALSTFLNKSNMNSYYFLSNALKDLNSFFPVQGSVSSNFLDYYAFVKNYSFKKSINSKLLEFGVKNFYLNSNVLKVSLTMQKCSKTILIHKNSYKNYFNNN